MRCPFCGNEETQVKDSRPTEDSAAIRRRRSCPECGERFTTFERLQLREMSVVKVGDRRQPFDSDKIIRSMQIALRKRPVEFSQIEKAASGIVRQLESQGEHEILSADIGAQVMKALIELDIVGYIRYASVYKKFNDTDDFNDFLEELKNLPVNGRKAS
ncbi:MAG: transcriptional repressor NrdR [Alphaproteobacteria bacterium]|nr:transcriptional repressor NrdR [Alphaproteobacteria bacterium]